MAAKITRRQVRAWLRPIRDCFTQIKSGEVDAIRGYPVTRLHHNDDYARIDYCIAGFRGMIERVCKDINTAPLLTLESKLANGVPLTVREIDDAQALLHRCEDALVGFPRDALLDAVVTEQIVIEMNAIGEKGKALNAH